MNKNYNRSAEDLGNIVALEHVNLQIEDQGVATLFYISGLGLTRDPYLMTSIDNMWVNVGRSQFHLPTGKPQRLRGRVGLIVPDRAALLRRLENMRKPLEGTRFDFVERADHVEATCPWGNTFLCHDPSPRFGKVALGMPYVEFDVPVGAATGIADFYRRVFGATASVDKSGDSPAARISAGDAQELVFRESKTKLPAYDGHHIQVYVANFSAPHRQLLEHGLVTEESNQFQYRFATITDLKSGKPLVEIEHEVRSLTHPLYARPLVNRNAQQTNRSYVPGADAWVPGPLAAEMDDPRVAMRQRRFADVARRGAARRA
jgi:predicted enzyme related to lactoylglutathione lyase